MKELRELINDPVVSAFLDILPHHDTVAVICTGLGERRFTTIQLKPLIAMHNAFPELLDMAETLLAVEQYVKTPTIPCCDDPTYDDGKETERLAVLDIISEYRERGNK